MAKKRRRPCPAGIEDACPVPRYRCREVGELGRHCFELFAEFELFVLPDADDAEEEVPPVGDAVTNAVLRQLRTNTELWEE